MTKIVDQLADLTALRDRDSLDTALLATLRELLQLDNIAIYRLVGPSGNEHWLTCALVQNGIDQYQPDQGWSELDDLPPAADYPQRQLALSSHQPVIATETETGIGVFPLATQSAANGVLELRSTPPLYEESVRLVSAVLRLYQNFQGLLDYGERDALTELLNRKTFDGAFLKATATQIQASELSTDDRRHSQAGGSYWLAMLDIDHFKHVNDNFGHLIGDEVLLLLARLMRSTFRFHDQLYRFGGEEFVVLMHCTEGGQAEVAFERLRSNTEQHQFPQVEHITISVGFTEIRHGDSPSAAFERADKAVYYAKEHGRNQVCNYETLVAQGKLAAEASNVGDIELF
ncbi:MAG: GGDEF domain-containing protein [Rhodoferax sp.]|nr:GGDEF domain-containing protein [Rhodoferax sp.]OIP14183.1 MAG: GGDEF domain-containing protein [Comamonadaceae bacterium CG2_30_57_122]PIZ23065.1 MAG: GGDEF domain-containing protein [Comamonadaceae bacterium CG_4_10_14_0_8_um_filter_57_29]PJC14476.1 MAG: GGDEF domain-containing protein [Comamonadaceae bacterium CG_4_9_14_0_8_um_filter_57_21]NCP81677.1 GGDEF domain-containing protein [Rhodoferax sp.]